MPCELFPLLRGNEAEMAEYAVFMQARKDLTKRVVVETAEKPRKGKFLPWNKVSTILKKMKADPSCMYLESLSDEGVALRPSSGMEWYQPAEGPLRVTLLEGLPPCPFPASTAEVGSTVTLNDGREMPRMGLGVYRVTAEDAEDTVRCALEAGYRHIDTATIYNNEEAVGRAIKASGIPREQIWITTKFYPKNQHGAEEVEEECRESLERLGVEYIDLYLVHTPAGRAGRKETWQGMQAMRAAGLVRSIGVSNYGAHHLKALLAEESCTVLPAVNQVELSPFMQRDDLVHLCAQHNITLAAYSPLTKGTSLDNPKLGTIAEKHGATAAQVLLKWGLQRGFAVLPKSTNPERIVENFAAAQISLDEEDMSELNLWDSYDPTGWDPTAEE